MNNSILCRCSFYVHGSLVVKAQDNVPNISLVFEKQNNSKKKKKKKKNDLEQYTCFANQNPTSI